MKNLKIDWSFFSALMQSLVVDLAQIPTKYVLLTCHRHSCLYHDLSQLQIRVLLCPPTSSLSPLVTSYPFPAPDKTVGLSFKLSLSHLVTSWPDPAPKKCAALLPEVVTVKVGYIIASSSSIPICWSVPLSCQCHCWLHNSDLFFSTDPVLFLPYWPFQLYISCWKSPSAPI